MQKLSRPIVFAAAGVAVMAMTGCSKSEKDNKAGLTHMAGKDAQSKTNEIQFGGIKEHESRRPSSRDKHVKENERLVQENLGASNLGASNLGASGQQSAAFKVKLKGERDDDRGLKEAQNDPKHFITKVMTDVPTVGEVIKTAAKRDWEIAKKDPMDVAKQYANVPVDVVLPGVRQGLSTTKKVGQKAVELIKPAVHRDLEIAKENPTGYVTEYANALIPGWSFARDRLAQANDWWNRRQQKKAEEQQQQPQEEQPE